MIFLGVNLLMDVRLWMFLLYAGILFFCFGLMFGNLNSLSMEPMGHIAGIASAIIGSISSVLSMCLGTIIGQLYNNTLIPLISGFLILGTLSFLFMLYAEKSASGRAASHN
jgi:DHA1 family bicyclomycin/chloramphenicol resistance-like MFS transporter